MDFNEIENAHVAHSLMMSTLRGVEVVYPGELEGSALEAFKTEIAEVWADRVVRTVAMRTGAFPQFVTMPQLVDICLYHLRFMPDHHVMGLPRRCAADNLYRDGDGVLRCSKCKGSEGCGDTPWTGDEA